MKILVTGAKGFIGTHLTAELQEHGHEVIGSDIAWHDLSAPYRGKCLIEEHRPDYVVHLAARYGRLLCAAEPHKSVSDNAAATTEIAATCAELQIPVLYTSSSEVYGDHGTATISEESELRQPTTIYGLSKRWGEEALRLYLPPDALTIVRANMLYGPEQIGGWGRCSLATFIRLGVRYDIFEVHRGTTRSWLYISDAVDALRKLIEGGRRGTFNLGNPAPAIPMEEVGDLVERMAGGAMSLTDPPAGQIRHKNYDCQRITEAIDWWPVIPLEEGVRRTVEWARQEALSGAAV